MKIPKYDAYQMFLKLLKKRNAVSDKKAFKKVPYELKAIIYFSQYKESDYDKLDKFLSAEIGGNI